MAQRILIVGGGVAGCYLAAALAAQGKQVTLIERAGRLGGRAAAFIDKRSHDQIELGPHLIMGCYEATRRFAHLVGAAQSLQFQKRLSIPYRLDSHTEAEFTCPPLPAPLHVGLALLRFRCLGLRDRIAGLRTWRRLARYRRLPSGELDRVIASRWLTDGGQTVMLQHLVWEPICRAALNLPLEESSAKLFANVLVEAFCRSHLHSRLGYVRGGMGTLCDRDARLFLESHGARVLVRTRASRLVVRDGRVSGVLLRSGESLDADCVVCAVAPWDLRPLLNASGLTGMEQAENLGRFEAAPILTLNLWLDRQITDHHFVYLCGKRFHWLFDNRRHSGAQCSSPCYSLLVSGPTPLLDVPKAELESMAWQDLEDLFPTARKARVLRSSVSRQRYATYAPRPGVESFRPGSETSVGGLYLAGDWTATGLPATIESASRSAETVIALLA